MSDPTPEQQAAMRDYANRQSVKKNSDIGATLTAEERERIRAEETYRAQIQSENYQAAVRANAPSYWLGFCLNLLIIGIGHIVIGEYGWAAIWFLLAIILVPATGGIAWPFVAIGVLVHYNRMYKRKYD